MSLTREVDMSSRYIIEQIRQCKPGRVSIHYNATSGRITIGQTLEWEVTRATAERVIAWLEQNYIRVRHWRDARTGQDGEAYFVHRDELMTPRSRPRIPA